MKEVIQPILTPNFYSISFADYDKELPGQDLLCEIRRAYFESGEPTKDKVAFVEKGKNCRVAYAMRNKRPMKWKLFVNGRLAEKSRQSAEGGYCIESYDSEGNLRKVTCFTQEHIWKETKYFLKTDPGTPEVVISAFEEEDALRLCRSGLLEEDREQKLFPCAPLYSQQEKILLNDIVGEPAVCCRTSNGELYYCCSEECGHREQLLLFIRKEMGTDAGPLWPERRESEKPQEEPVEEKPAEEAADAVIRQSENAENPENPQQEEAQKAQEEAVTAKEESQVEPADGSADSSEESSEETVAEDIEEKEEEISAASAEEPLDKYGKETSQAEEKSAAEEEKKESESPETPREELAVQDENKEEELSAAEEYDEEESLSEKQEQNPDIAEVSEEDVAEKVRQTEMRRYNVLVKPIGSDSYLSDEGVWLRGKADSEPEKKEQPEEEEQSEKKEQPEEEEQSEKKEQPEKESFEKEEEPEKKAEENSFAFLRENEENSDFLPVDPERSVAFNKEILTDSGEHYYYFGSLEDGLRSGRGRTAMQDGKTAYEGEYAADRREGFGVYYYSTGRLCYAGGWKNNQRHGTGVSFRPQNGMIHVGCWEEDKPDGMGARFDASGNLLYSGKWKDGKRQGAGITYRAEDGSIFIGQWKDDALTGLGSEFAPDGSLLYTGFWKRCRREGYGTEFGPDGRIVYTGEFHDGSYCGEGTLFLPDGRRLCGSFREGKLCGPGRVFSADGSLLYEGRFKNGSCCARKDDSSKKDACEPKAVQPAPKVAGSSLKDEAWAKYEAWRKAHLERRG